MPSRVPNARAAMLSALCVLILAATAPFHPASGASTSTEEILKAIVKVEATVPAEARTAKSLGTDRSGHGALISSDGLILTIGYLILEAESVTVTQHDGRQLPATVVAYDHNSGFGLLRVARPLSATPLTLGDSSALRADSLAVAASHGGSGTAVPVKIVARRDFAGYWEYLLEDAIFTVPPFQDFGGAALLNENGELVGIGSLLVVDAEEPGSYAPGNMFIPINRFKAIRDELVASGRTRKPNHPWIGLYTEEVRGRLFVQRVARGGPSDAAGLRTGDIVVSVGDKPVRSQVDFYRTLWSYGGPGARIPITVLTADAGLRTAEVASVDRYSWLRKPRGN